MNMWTMIAVISVTYYVASMVSNYYKSRSSQLPPDPQLRARVDELENRLRHIEPRIENLETIAADREVDLARKIADYE